ncbi:hypothetical protein ACFY9F_24620 [Streptomyces sp. NPDC012421]|uniref:hypothetical protein n=1 Tax=unclassified Streptomyces TaxID=2593676 RepID=UPI003691AD47
MLIKHLPRESALQREIHGEAAEWSVTDHLLAATVDHLAVGNWMFSCVNSGEDGDPPEFPKPVPRPESKGNADGSDGTDGSGDGEGTETNGAATAPRNGEEPPAISPGQLARFFG